MNSSQLKYGEIFCFLALLFLILFLFLSYRSEKSAIHLNFPPNITIKNTGKYAFPISQATLPLELKKYLAGEIVSKIKDSFQKYDINTIEVIGHTDGLEVSQTSNLDNRLNKVATENINIEELKAGSNADLGLMRALAVVKELQNEEKLLQVFKNRGLDKDKVFRAYSAAQLYLPNRKTAPPDPNAKEERRRIEIRFTKLSDEEN